MPRSDNRPKTAGAVECSDRKGSVAPLPDGGRLHLEQTHVGDGCRALARRKVAHWQLPPWTIPLVRLELATKSDLTSSTTPILKRTCPPITLG